MISQHLVAETTAHPFCTCTTIFQNVNNPFNMLLCFTFQNMGEKCFGSRSFLIFGNIRTSVLGECFFFLYMHSETEIDDMP